MQRKRKVCYKFLTYPNSAVNQTTTSLTMTATSSLAISAEHISVPEALPAFVHSLIGVPNNPASLYLSINPRSLIIYVAPASTVNVINLSHLSVALRQENGSASALKTLLETGTTTKVFFDARIPAKVLFECCGIKLSNEVRCDLTCKMDINPDFRLVPPKLLSTRCK